jgi:hypothetical protein
MCNDQSDRQPEWVAFHLRREWIAIDDNSPKELWLVPQSIERIALGNPVDEQVVPAVLIYENEPPSEDDGASSVI